MVGAIEYDFDVVEKGWYVLHVQPDGGGHEFIFDGKELLYGFGSSRVGNIWLDAGSHTLRIQRNFWTGLGPITEWRLEPARAASDRISVRSDDRWNVLRKGETLPVTVQFGDLAGPATLTMISNKVGQAGKGSGSRLPCRRAPGSRRRRRSFQRRKKASSKFPVS